MTFDTWWKEQGSLHNDIFSLPFESREIFKRIAQTAWEESDRPHADEVNELEEEIDSLTAEVEDLKEKLGDLKEELTKEKQDKETLKASILSCL